jgi:two-component system, chemotaxis family, chemotaxis protein CheY
MARILVVDDSSLSRRIMRSILEPAGHSVQEASDGMMAIERYFLDRPDLVLLDLLMEGLEGLDVLARLREMDAGARVIVATSDIQASTEALVRTGGALALIRKPFQAREVLDAVNAALKKPPEGASP